MFFEGKLTFNDQIYITNIRHKAAIQEAVDSLKMVLQRSYASGVKNHNFYIPLHIDIHAVGAKFRET